MAGGRVPVGAVGRRVWVNPSSFANVTLPNFVLSGTFDLLLDRYGCTLRVASARVWHAVIKDSNLAVHQ